MAKPHTHCNLPLIGKDKLTEDAPEAPTKNNGTLTPIFAIFYILTSMLAQIPTSIQASTPASGPPDMYINIDLQKATKLALELFIKSQKYGQANWAS